MFIKVSRFLIVVLIVLLVNIALILSVSGINSEKKTAIPYKGFEWKEGDLIFRNGYGLISNWFQSCSLKDPAYSHAGIVVLINGKPFVVHMQQNIKSLPLLTESVSDFWSRNVCSKGALYRTDLSHEQLTTMLQSIHADRYNTPEFDFAFNLDDTSRYYCSEWIREKFIRATGDIAFFPITKLDNFNYISTDNLYLNSHTQFIYRWQYK